MSRIFRACCYADAPARPVACSQYETRLLLHVILTTHTDDNGETYYFDPKTGKTGWHLSEFAHDHEEDDIQEQTDYATG